MSVVDLTTPPPQPPALRTDLRTDLPRRLTLTLPELRLAAALAGDTPLPFSPADRDDRRLVHRLGATGDTPAAYARALGALPEPRDSLSRRGLLGDSGLDGSLTGALGLLGAPRLALDLAVTVAGRQARSWHRQAGDMVASLATSDGLVFELAWFLTRQWADELARVARLPEDLAPTASAVPSFVGLPYELADAAGEALRTHRAELLPELVARWPGQVVDAEGRPLDQAAAVVLLSALTTETRGRLRVLAAASGRTPIAVASWLLVGDGWRAVRPDRAEVADRVELRAVAPEDLSPELAHLLAGVVS